MELTLTKHSERFFAELETIDPELHGLTELVYRGFKYAGSTERQFRLSSLIPALSYAKIRTAEVKWIDGQWKLGTVRSEEFRRDRFLEELKGIRLSDEKDEEYVKNEIASLLQRYHK